MKAPKFVVSGTYCCLKGIASNKSLAIKKNKNLRDVWGKGSDESSLIPEEETISHYKDDCPCVL